jgi:flagellar biosynthesis protein FliR
MNPVEYKPVRRPWIREVLVGAAIGVVSNLVLELLTAAARLLG